MIDWCCKQKKGISLIEPNINMSNDYIKRAELDLITMNESKGHWEVITAYYACYDILYALLMKCGIKSEIHDCSIALMELFGFSQNDIDFMKTLKSDRIDVQYYLKEIPLKDKNRVKDFVLRVKDMIKSINSDESDNILKELMVYD